MLCSGGEGKGTVYVGNKGVASTRDRLKRHEVTHIVNCTVSRPTIQAHAHPHADVVAAALWKDMLPNYFEAEAGMSYYRFPINLWMQYVTRCMPVLSNHSMT